MRARQLTGPLVLGLLAAWLTAAMAQPQQLEFKYKAGQVLRYRITGNLTGDFNVSGISAPQGQPLPNGAVSATGSAGLVVKVIAAFSDGTARLSCRLTNFASDMSLPQGHRMTMKMVNGQLSMTVDGKPVKAPPNAMGMPGAPGGKMTLPGVTEPIVVKVSKYGKLLSVSGGGLDQLQRMAPGPNLNQLLQSGPAMLPPYPVQPGDGWMTKTSVPFPMGQPLDVVTNYSLLGYEQLGSRRVAKIVSRSSFDLSGQKLNLGAIAGGSGAQMPSLSFDTFKTSSESNNYLDSETGQIVKGDLALEYNIAMGMPAPAGPSGQQPRIEVNLQANATWELQ